MLTKKQKANEIYLSLLPFKRSFQSTITSLLYKFKWNGLDINKWIDPQVSFLFQSLLKEYSKKNDNTKIWDHIRFYLKGGKALNKLLNKMANEEMNSLIYTTEEVFEDKLCFLDQGCITESNSDYDFTLLIKDEDDFPNNDPDQGLSVLLVQLLTQIGNNLLSKDQFISFVNSFQHELNKKENLYLLISSLKYSLFEMKKFVKEKEGKERDYIINYIKIKIIQVDNFIKKIKEKIKDKKELYTGWEIKTTYTNDPIEIKVKGDESIFYLYRLKLCFNINEPVIKLNRDIKNFLQNKIDVDSIPFDNIFGELIDISLPIGDENVLKELWASTDLEWMLRPIQGIDTEFNDEKDKDFFIRIKEGKEFLYPVASLRYQLKDIITVFNIENPTKLRKRCTRFVEYLKMMCYSEEIPSSFYVNLSPQLKKEIREELIFSLSGEGCSELVDILNILSENKIVHENNYDRWVLDKKQLTKIFPTSFCGDLVSGSFPAKDKLVRIIFLKIKLNSDFPDKLNIYQLKKINYKSLIEILKNIENVTLIKRYIQIINHIDIINRILPIEIDI
jgi:hypothetical protein